MSTDNVALTSVGFQLLTRSRIKVIAVGSAVTAILVGAFIGFYYRRKKKPTKTPPTAKPKVEEMTNAVASKRGQSPLVGLARPTSSASTAASHVRRRGSASRSTSVSAGDTLLAVKEEGALARKRIIHAAVNSLSESVEKFELAIRMTMRESRVISRQDREFVDGLETALDVARHLEADFNSLIERFCPDALDEESMSGTLTPVGSQHAIYDTSIHSSGHVPRTFSVLSDDSFVSAMEELILSFPEVEAPVHEIQALPFERLEFYKEGLAKVQEGEVQCRSMRTEFLHCTSDEDFLAKVYCVREALSAILQNEQKRSWISEVFRDLVTNLLEQAKKEPETFHRTYDALLEFMNNVEDWTEIEAELVYRKVKKVTFYDVVLDLILMDSFDELAHPPGSLLAVAQNSFFGAGFKEATVRTIVWSVIKAKRARAWSSHGFFARFYDICENVSPVMAWGFLGTDEALRELCYYFKDQVCNFLTDIFSMDRVRYTNLNELAEDIYQICQARMSATRQKLAVRRDSAPPSPSPPSSLNHVNGLEDDR